MPVQAQHILERSRAYSQPFTIAVAVAACILLLTGSASAQAVPHDLKSWQLDFSIAGTIAGLNEHITLNQVGELTADCFGSHFSGHAPPELMTKVKDWLQSAQPEKPVSGNAIPDALLLSAALTFDGRRYPLQMPGDLYQPLQASLNAVFKQTLVGSWQQSGWKLCRPAALLTAADYDTPIDELSFHPDGTFTVTWRGGGARMYGQPSASGAGSGGVPHTALPDYQGRYQLSPESGYITMKFEHGIATPRDFSGDGHLTIISGQLTLQSIWLGTRQVPKKPDICELTFTRHAETGPAAAR